ncbi:sulfotransferase [Spiribacter roseus]|uniref:Sulfotransferase n=1 Tax=Spiribacter roseus TaxID=1855875 RepID=A0ABV3S2W2_9GAMM
MNRRSLAVRIGRLAQSLPQSWLRPIESPFVRTLVRADPNVIFLLALPRSGSTLTYQALVHALEPHYLSNLGNLLYGLPWLGLKSSQLFCGHHDSNFRSKHGFVEGLCGPAEGLKYWSYWTGVGLTDRHTLARNDGKLAQRVNYFRDAVRATATPRAPMIAGYLGHTLVAKQLREWFPSAVFIRLHRDPLSNALSLLRSRADKYNKWFSVKPKECEDMEDRTVQAQVAAQVYWLNRRLDALAHDDRTINIGYEELANAPNTTMNRIIHDGNACGLSLEMQKTLPSYFTHRVADPDQDKDAAAIFNEIRNLEQVHGPLKRSAQH